MRIAHHHRIESVDVRCASCESSGQELQICVSRTAIESNRSMCDAHLVIFLAKSYKNAYPKSCTHTLEKWFEKTRPFVWGAHKVCSSLCSPNEDAWENEHAIFCNHATLLQITIYLSSKRRFVPIRPQRISPWALVSPASCVACTPSLERK